MLFLSCFTAPSALVVSIILKLLNMLAIVGASGKIGGAVLDALLSYTLLDPQGIVACTSSSQGSETWKVLEAKRVRVRHATFEDETTIEIALAGCKKLFLVSTPRIELDYNDAKPGAGREAQHFKAIDAARKAKVEHVYYTSLAFGPQSMAGVMQAHLRTENYLSTLDDIKSTVLREGLYNESWPLYLGYFEPKSDGRERVTVAGDGKVSWTSIADLGLASALVLTAKGKTYAGKTLYLTSDPVNAKTLAEVAEMVGQARSKSLALRVVSQDEYEAHYIEDRKMEAPGVKWWSSSYSALENGECLIQDSPLVGLLRSKGRTPKPISETIKEMVAQ